VLKNGKDEEIFSAGEVVAEQFHVSSSKVLAFHCHTFWDS
jgi:hypothetical protein